MADKKELLSLANLGRTHEGRTGEVFAGELLRIVEDCQGRPSNSKPRSLTIQIDVRPESSDRTGDLETIDYEVRIKPAKLPNFEPSYRERARVQKNGQLLMLFKSEGEGEV